MPNLNLIIPAGDRLPDGKLWINRFQIQSESSDALYTVSQNKVHRHWGCSCMGWIFHRSCKHLKALGLPNKEVPMEVTINATTKKVEVKSFNRIEVNEESLLPY